jgi:hypothetical protein
LVAVSGEDLNELDELFVELWRNPIGHALGIFEEVSIDFHEELLLGEQFDTEIEVHAQDVDLLAKGVLALAFLTPAAYFVLGVK